MPALVVYLVVLVWWVACMYGTYRLADGPLPEKTAVEFRIIRMEARLEATTRTVYW